MLKPCMEELSAKYGVAVTAEETASRIGNTPEDLRFVPGIGIYVRGEVATDRVIDSLEEAVARRRGTLLMHPAKVIDMTQMRTSSLQAVVDRCIFAALVAPIKNSEDFVRTYGPFLTNDAPAELRIEGLYAMKHPVKNRVMVISKAGRDTVEAMNGQVLVLGDGGRTAIHIRASGWLHRFQPRD